MVRAARSGINHRWQRRIDTLGEALAALDLAEAENELADVKAALVLARETIQKKFDLLQEI